MLVAGQTRKTIDSFLSRKLHSQPWAEDDIQFYARDVGGNVYHVDSFDDADRVVFRYKN